MQVSPEILHWLEPVSKVVIEQALALFAIGFAWKQYKDSAELKDKTEEIAKSMTTRYVQMFPENFEELIELVSQPKDSLDILLDYSGYGHYGSPIEFEKYLNALRARKPHLRKRMIVYSSSLTQSIFASREFTAAVWQEMRATAAYKDFFARGYCPTTRNEPATVEEFRAIMLRNLGYYLYQLQKEDFEIRCVDTEGVIFTWIADDLDAMVSFRSQKEDDTEAAFRTRDPRLLTTLRVLFETTWAKASPLPEFRTFPDQWNAPGMAAPSPGSNVAASSL